MLVSLSHVFLSLVAVCLGGSLCDDSEYHNHHPDRDE